MIHVSFFASNKHVILIFLSTKNVRLMNLNPFNFINIPLVISFNDILDTVSIILNDESKETTVVLEAVHDDYEGNNVTCK